jgi:hypothetical protein
MQKSNSSKFNIQFKDKLNDKEYMALCVYDVISEKREVIIKDKRKKKGIKSPDYEFDINASYFTIPQEYEVLIYNKKAELVLRNKIFEIFIRTIEMQNDQDAEIDYKAMYNQFGQYYENIIKETGVYEKYLKLDFLEKEHEIQN